MIRRKDQDWRGTKSVARRRDFSFLLNPAVVYSGTWTAAVLCLYAGWANTMTPPTRAFLVLVAGNIALSFAAYQIARMFKRLAVPIRRVDGPKPDRLVDSTVLLRYADLAFAVWALGSAVNIYASRGLPILWLLSGDSRTYSDFGVPTLSGIAAASGLFATLCYFLIQLTSRTGKRWWAILSIFLYTVGVINRGLIVWMFVEMLAVYLQIGRLTGRRVIRGAAVLVVLVLLFGQLGEMRMNMGPQYMLKATSTEEGYSLFRHLPTGAWWTYSYATVGAVNVNAALGNVTPLGYPYWSVLTLFPTVVRQVIYTHTTYEARYPLAMVNAMGNVFTMYGGYIADFGIPGCFVITFVFQLLAAHYFIAARNGDPLAIVAYSVMFQVIVVSLFTDSFLGWLTLFQLLLAHAFRYYLNVVRRWRVLKGAAVVRKKAGATTGPSFDAEVHF